MGGIRFGISPINNVTDLITYSADDKIFKRTDLYNRYFNWFIETVTKDEIKQIYNQIGINVFANDEPIK